MSSILLHGFLPAQFFLRWWWMAVLVAIQAMLPDLIGIVGGSINGNWDAYAWAHQYHWWLIPFGSVHVWMDSFLHNPTGDWNVWAWWIEALFWSVSIGSLTVRYNAELRVLDDRYPVLMTVVTVVCLLVIVFLYYKAISGLL